MEQIKVERRVNPGDILLVKGIIAVVTEKGEVVDLHTGRVYEIKNVDNNFLIDEMKDIIVNGRKVKGIVKSDEKTLIIRERR